LVCVPSRRWQSLIRGSLQPARMTPLKQLTRFPSRQQLPRLDQAPCHPLHQTAAVQHQLSGPLTAHWLQTCCSRPCRQYLSRVRMWGRTSSCQRRMLPAAQLGQQQLPCRTADPTVLRRARLPAPALATPTTLPIFCLSHLTPSLNFFFRNKPFNGLPFLKVCMSLLPGLSKLYIGGKGQG
jgi:hypothetical protein